MWAKKGREHLRSGSLRALRAYMHTAQCMMHHHVARALHEPLLRFVVRPHVCVWPRCIMPEKNVLFG